VLYQAEPLPDGLAGWRGFGRKHRLARASELLLQIAIITFAAFGAFTKGAVGQRSAQMC
jgi:hypothetical protein